MFNISLRTLDSHTTSLAVSDNAMYSDSALDKATLSCLLDLQCTGLLPMFINSPVVDFLSSRSEPQEASEYATRLK